MESLTLVQDTGNLIEGFCRDCKLRGMTEESIRRYKSSLLIFATFLSGAGVSVEGVDADVLRDFLRHILYDRKVKRKTTENYFSALSAFYDYLAFDGLVSANMVLPFRKRYLRRYKDGSDDAVRKLLSIEEMAGLVGSIMDPRDKAIALMLAKTGIRRGELLKLDVDSINWLDYSVTLKPTPKRSNRTVFFDDECAIVLRRWLRIREKLSPETNALFVSYQSLNRFDRNGLYTAMVKHARNLGFYDSLSSRLEDHFSPHCFRHWFTTWLLRNGMPREYVKELRGDRRSEAIDIYHHIDREELRRSYLAYVPKLGV